MSLAKRMRDLDVKLKGGKTEMARTPRIMIGAPGSEGQYSSKRVRPLGETKTRKCRKTSKRKK